MAKRIKLTESQIKLLASLNERKQNKKVRITESQFNRLFKGKENIQEDGGLGVEFLTFAQETIMFMKGILTDPSQAGLSPFWVKLGVTRGELFSTMVDLGIITAGTVAAGNGVKKVMNIKKKGLIRALKRMYNMFCENPRYDIKTGKVINQDKTQDEGTVFLGNDMELEENGNLPPGAEHDSNAPWNKEDRVNPQAGEHFDVIDEITDNSGYNLLFLKDELGKYVVIYKTSSVYFEDFCGPHAEMGCVLEKLNHQVEVGEIDEDVLEELTPEMVEFILDMHVSDSDELTQKVRQIAGLNEVTTTASSGAFEGPFGDGPIKKKIHPSDGLNESEEGEEIDEATDTSSSGSYEQPQIWAKDPKNSRFSHDPMYPDGTIVERVAKQTGRTIEEVREILKKK